MFGSLFWAQETADNTMSNLFSGLEGLPPTRQLPVTGEVSLSRPHCVALA